GGFGGKSDILAENFVYGGTPDFYKKSLANIDNATPKQVQAVAKRWFTEGHYQLTVVPFDTTLTAKGDGIDRSALPYPTSYPEVGFTDFERGELSNGMKLLVANYGGVPLVNLSMIFDAGYASDQLASPGTAGFALSMLDEGTRSRNALEISDAFDNLGANFSAGSNLDNAFVSLNALTDTLDDALDLYADIILNPAFPEKELERVRKLRLAGIARERAQPQAMALRVLPKLMYGADHAYGQPLTGSGTEQSVAAITQADLQAYHDAWIRPNNATLVVVGDTTLEKIKPMLEARFSKWAAKDVPQKTLDNVALAEAATVYIIDRPESEQSLIFAGHVVPAKSDQADLAIEAANQVLGGDFPARLNMNLREDKGWSYGSYSFVVDAAVQRPWIVSAPVQTDKTAESMAEIRREVTEYVNGNGAQEDELARVRDSNTLSLPGRWETIGAVSGSLSEMVRFNLPDDYWNTFADQTRQLTLDAVNEQAQRVLKPDSMIWVVVGDRAKIEGPIRELGFDRIEMIDTNGDSVE
ncbi:MAG: pitrilysin family protein, partial [Pseudomonadota bacterium]